MVRRQIAKVGKWGQDGTEITEADLKEVVDTFVDEAPISLGHSLVDWMPKLGNIKAPLYDQATQTLTAEVNPNELLADAEQKGLYDKWSVGIKRRASDGKKYIHHLAFLGEVPAKIKGLKILDGTFVNASDADEVWAFRIDDKPTTEVNEMSDDIIRIKALEAQILRTKKDKLREVITGKLPKRMHKSVMDLADSLGNPHGLRPIQFSDSEGKKTERSALDILIEIFEAISKSLNFSDEEEGERIDLTKYV